MDTSKFKGIFPALCEVGGKTWSARKVIDEERGGYADIAADTKNGKIYILYENNFGAELYLAVLDENEI